MSSLALVQGYSSESEEENHGARVRDTFSDSESEASTGDEGSLRQEDQQTTTPAATAMSTPMEQPFDSSLFPPAKTSSSVLPSAAMVFSEVTGPPEYLKDSAGNLLDIQSKLRAKKIEESKKSNPNGAVVEAKAQPAIPDRGQSNSLDESWKLRTADAATKHLGVCQNCNVPKTYSAAREGLVCPVCKDRSVGNDGKRGSKIKDKEKSKRMRGQSSHATWKSETEMHLRQQFD